MMRAHEFVAVICAAALATVCGTTNAAGSGFFSVGRDADGRWRVYDPDGSPFVIRGIDHATYIGHGCEVDGHHHYEDTNKALFPDRKAWERDTAVKLKKWGFNMLASGCDSGLREQGIPYAFFAWMGQGYCSKNGRNASITGEAGGTGRAFPNVYATNFVSWCENWARQHCAHRRNDRNLVGYFIDNELKWWALDGMSSEKRREIAERYFSVTTSAIRKADPNHLILGCRFAAAGDDVWEVAGKYCDILSVNIYPWADLDRNVVFCSRRPGSPKITDVFRRYSSLAGGKPLLITEWSFPALDSGLPCTIGSGQRFRTQTERAAASELYARTMLASSELVGYDYFMWVDEPALGISRTFTENSNYGLVAESGKVYAEITQMFERLHAEVESGAKIEMPRERVCEPYLKSATVALGEFGWIGETDALVPMVEVSGGNWKVANADGLVLKGSLKGGALVGSVEARRGVLGSVNGMLQCSSGGEGGYIDLGGVVSFTNFAARGMTWLTVAAQSAVNGTPFRMTYDIAVPMRGQSFLMDLKSIENLGESPIEVTRVYWRQFSPFHAETPRSSPLIRELWKSDLIGAWTAKDGRYFGVFTRALMVDAVKYWNDPDGKRQHPDAMFIPPQKLVLSPGCSWSPKGGMWVRIDTAP